MARISQYRLLTTSTNLPGTTARDTPYRMCLQSVISTCALQKFFTDRRVQLLTPLFGCTPTAPQIVKILDGKFVLGDTGFQNCNTCLVPYCNVQYHLQEWARGNRGPQNAQELFNKRHSQLRNVIERIFGVMKACYKILTYPRPFCMKAQVRVVAVLCVLHNILNNFDKDEKVTVTIVTSEEAGEEDANHVYNISRMEVGAATAKRDAIANAMWSDYIARRQRLEST